MLGQRFLQSGLPTRLFSTSLVSRSILASTASPILRMTTNTSAKKVLLTQRLHFSTTRPATLPRATPSSNNVGLPKPSEEVMQAVDMLEKTAAQPFLRVNPTDPEDKLRRAATLILQIVLYLGIPRGTSEQGLHFLMAFGSAPVGGKSEIARARRASAPIIRAVIRDINSVPESHPIREQAKDMFDSLKIVTMLSELHLVEEEDAAFTFMQFWPGAQDHFLLILDELNAAGYGVDMQELSEEAQAEANADKAQS